MILNKNDKYSRYSLYAIIIFSLIVLSLTAVYHVSGDGCWHMQAAKFMADNRKLPLFEPIGRNEPFWSPPFYHLIAAAVFSIFSENAAYFLSKFLSPLFGIGSLIVLFLLVKKLYSPKIAFYSVIFLASIPIFMDYGILSYVEAMLVFFVILSVYLCITEKLWLCGIAAGLASFTKYNGLFIIPVLVYIRFRKSKMTKKFLIESAKIIVPVIIAAGPWLIRNWIYLGNPVWPFMNSVFSGYSAPSYEGTGVTTSFNIGNLFHPNALIYAYLGFFGVPDGNYKLLNFFNLPYMGILIPIWLICTMIFILPVFFGIGKGKTKNGFLSVWIASYFVLLVLYVANASWSVSRIILPAVPVLAVLWAVGFDRIQKKTNVSWVVAALIIAGFVFTIFLKVTMAANSWDFYRDDFSWVIKNIPKDAVFIANGQCIPYNIRKTSMQISQNSIETADYLWMNQKFALDKRSIYNEQEMELLNQKNLNLAYRNDKTGTFVYSIEH